MNKNITNTANPEDVAKSKQKIRNDRKQELMDISKVMSKPYGRRLLWRIINKLCHVDSSSAEHSGSITYMKEGERNIGRILKSDIYETAIEQWHKMDIEYMESIKED